MGEASKIEWTDHTFNPWWGCTKVSPACDHCYAEAWARRTGHIGLWDGARRIFGSKHWREPLKWNQRAEQRGTRFLVFCASMADVLDSNAPPGERERLWELIEATPRLDWLLLTKRIGNAQRMVPVSWLARPRANVWLGATIANQEELLRDAPKLLATPAQVRFLSCEPLLGPLEFGSLGALRGLHWVICGGESGGRARPLEAEWAVRLREQCAARGIAFFMKQGSQANWDSYKDISTFLPELRVREWPERPVHDSNGDRQ